MFINISNHPSGKWSEGQLAAARELGGEIRDIAFPNVPPKATTQEIAEMAETIAVFANAENGDVVMVQGEFSLTYAATKFFRENGIKVVVACSERRVTEQTKADGTTEKSAVFEFVQFREVL